MIVKKVIFFLKKILKPQNKTKTFIILWMHRSGTSLLANILSKKWIFMWDKLLKKSKYNKYWHFEDKFFLNFNELLLKWWWWKRYNIPKKQIQTWFINNIKIRLYSILLYYKIKQYSKKYNFWWFKEPRTLLTFNIIKKLLLNHEIFIVWIFRRPWDVVSSLIKRENMDPVLALNLWKKYNLYLLYYLRLFKKKSICIEYDDIINNSSYVENLLNKKLPWIKLNINDILDKKENHSMWFNVFYDSEIEKIYNELVSLKT